VSTARLLWSLVRVRDRTGIGAAEAASLESTTHRMLAGPAGGYGIAHWGAKGSPYEGGANTMLAASPQRFQGQAQMGASYNVSVQRYAALPNDQSPAALPSWVQDWDSLEGVV
jgi:hypothetical protein